MNGDPDMMTVTLLQLITHDIALATAAIVVGWQWAKAKQ